MTESTADTLREGYLARLEEAMRGLPHGVASDIRGGIEEELHGLDTGGTAARIEQLGDPVAIAREAQEEVPSSSPIVIDAPAQTPSTPRPPTTSTRGYAIVSALTLSIGGFIVPVLGWFVGAVLVVLSPLWKTWEKTLAIVVPFAFTALSFLIVSVMTAFSSEVSGSDSGEGAAQAATNPLVPSLGTWHVFVLLGFVLIPASGLWLLWRLRGRGAR